MGKAGKPIKHEDLTQVEQDFDDNRYASIMSRAGEKISFQVESRVLGPLVVPGTSACLRCLDLSRSDRDPAWPLIIAQLASQAADPPACDAVLAGAVAAHAAAQALAFIDRGIGAVAVADGTLELVLPDWQWKRRSWPRHPRCGCGTSCRV